MFKLKLIVLFLLYGFSCFSNTVESKQTKNYDYLLDTSIIGGAITKNASFNSIKLGTHSAFERVVFGITATESIGLDRVFPIYYHISSERFPNRLIFEFKSIEEFDEKILQNLSGDLIDKIYSLPTYQDSLIIVMELKQECGYEVFELSDPARLVIDLISLKENGYILKSKEFSDIELLLTTYVRVLEYAKNIKMHKNKNGTFYLEEGFYLTEYSVNKKRDLLNKKGFSFSVEKISIKK